MKYFMPFTVAVVMSGLLAGCQNGQDRDDNRYEHRMNRSQMHGKMAADGMMNINQAVAVIHPTQGNQTMGTVRFTRMGQSVKVVADIKGLQPSSKHGFHIHEFGDCTAPDAASAGGHYNPDGHPHAGPSAEPRHAGDFGNIESDAQGNARLELTVQNISIAGANNPVLGRAVIVHQKADDLQSQPTGDAGARIGCGIIGVAQMK